MDDIKHVFRSGIYTKGDVLAERTNAYTPTTPMLGISHISHVHGGFWNAGCDTTDQRRSVHTARFNRFGTRPFPAGSICLVEVLENFA